METLQNQIEEIKTIINNNGGVSSYPNRIKRNRPTGCPMRVSTVKEVKEGLSNQEYYIAFSLGLIGNNGHNGTIISNCHRFQF